MTIAFDIEAALDESPFPLYGVPGLTQLSVSTYSEANPLSLAGLGHGRNRRLLDRTNQKACRPLGASSSRH
jgi:hypothetical protein